MDEAKYEEVFKKYEDKLRAEGIPHRKFPFDALKPTRAKALAHCVSMLYEMKRFLREGRIDKVNRWLGFIQGVLWFCGIYTLNELKDHNRP